MLPLNVNIIKCSHRSRSLLLIWDTNEIETSHFDPLSTNSYKTCELFYFTHHTRVG